MMTLLFLMQERQEYSFLGFLVVLPSSVLQFASDLLLQLVVRETELEVDC